MGCQMVAIQLNPKFVVLNYHLILTMFSVTEAQVWSTERTSIVRQGGNAICQCSLYS